MTETGDSIARGYVPPWIGISSNVQRGAQSLVVRICYFRHYSQGSIPGQGTKPPSQF